MSPAFLYVCLGLLLLPCVFGWQGVQFSLALAATFAAPILMFRAGVLASLFANRRQNVVSIHENGILVRRVRRRFVPWSELQGFTVEKGGRGARYCLLDYGERAILPGIVVDLSGILGDIVDRAGLEVERDDAGNVQRAVRRARIEESPSEAENDDAGGAEARRSGAFMAS